MEEEFEKAVKVKITGKQNLLDLNCDLCRKICGEDSQFMLSENYDKLIKELVNFPNGHEYYIRPVFIYIDGIEVDDSYYSTAIEYFGLKPQQQFIRGLNIIARSLSPGFVGLLRNYGFVLDSVESIPTTVYKFDHISFV